MIDDERQADPGTVSLMGEARLRDQEQETAITQTVRHIGPRSGDTAEPPA